MDTHVRHGLSLVVDATEGDVFGSEAVTRLVEALLFIRAQHGQTAAMVALDCLPNITLPRMASGTSCHDGDAAYSGKREPDSVRLAGAVAKLMENATSRSAILTVELVEVVGLGGDPCYEEWTIKVVDVGSKDAVSLLEACDGSVRQAVEASLMAAIDELEAKAAALLTADHAYLPKLKERVVPGQAAKFTVDGGSSMFSRIVKALRPSKQV